MIDFAKKLYAELQLKFDDDHPGKVAPDERLQYLNTVIDQLKLSLKNYQFPGEAEEITFFKSELPLILSEFFYYSEKDAIFSRRIETQISRTEFLESRLAHFDNFFRANEEFVQYVRYNQTALDRFYFVRSNSFTCQHSEFPYFMFDRSFCTIYSWKLATLMAYSRLDKEIRRSYSPDNRTGIQALDGTTKDPSWPPDLERLVWTDPKNGLTELMYGLDEKKCFNYGKVDLTTIRRNLEICFSVDLGNTSSTYQKLISRKKGSDTYLSSLCEKYNQRIERMDEQELRNRLRS